MIDVERLAAFILVVGVLIAVPGPSVLFVVSRGIALGRKAAVATAAGNETGLLVQVFAAAFGLGAIVSQSLLVFSIIKLLGALYLVYLGVQAWRQRKVMARNLSAVSPAETGEAGGGTQARAAERPGRVFRQGFVVGATNPKGLLIFTAVLPQFVDPTRGGATTQFLVLGLICILIALISDTAWGVLAGTARTWLGRSPRRLEVMGGAAGVIMVGLGVQLAFTSQRT